MRTLPEAPDLPGVGLGRVVLRRCKLDAVTLQFARLAQVRFEELDLTGTRLTDVDLRDADQHVARGTEGVRGARPAHRPRPAAGRRRGLRVEPPD